MAHERHQCDVLFSDIVGFTSLASSLKPEDVVAVLNVMFASFDLLAIRHHIYKVETIGDGQNQRERRRKDKRGRDGRGGAPSLTISSCYLCVVFLLSAYVACANVVEFRPDHTKCLVDFALAMQRATKNMFTPTNQPLNIRVGIHTGSLIAGVVGRKMPRYHLYVERHTGRESGTTRTSIAQLNSRVLFAFLCVRFGETVTLAEEMEQKGVPGMVAMSDAAYRSMPASCLGEYECKQLEPVTAGESVIHRWTIWHLKKDRKSMAAAGVAAAASADGSADSPMFPSGEGRGGRRVAKRSVAGSGGHNLSVHQLPVTPLYPAVATPPTPLLVAATAASAATSSASSAFAPPSSSGSGSGSGAPRVIRVFALEETAAAVAAEAARLGQTQSGGGDVKPGGSTHREDAELAQSGDLLVAALYTNEAPRAAVAGSPSSGGRAGTAPSPLSAPLGQYLRSQRSQSVHKPPSAPPAVSSPVAAAVAASQRTAKSSKEKAFMPN